MPEVDRKKSTRKEETYLRDNKEVDQLHLLQSQKSGSDIFAVVVSTVNPPSPALLP